MLIPGLELLTPGDLPALATQSAGITGVSHLTQPHIFSDHGGIKLEINRNLRKYTNMKIVHHAPE